MNVKKMLGKLALLVMVMLTVPAVFAEIQPPRTAFAEKERHGQRDGQRIEEMNGRSDACGDVGIGEDEAQRTAGPEEAQQEDDAEIPAGDAQPPARRQPEEQQRRRGDAPAVGQHLER